MLYDLFDNCIASTCSGSITFHVVNIRTDIEFVFFTGEFATPCILTTTSPLSFANPNMPLYGHLSSVDSSETSVSLGRFLFLFPSVYGEVSTPADLVVR